MSWVFICTYVTSFLCFRLSFLTLFVLTYHDISQRNFNHKNGIVYFWQMLTMWRKWHLHNLVKVYSKRGVKLVTIGLCPPSILICRQPTIEDFHVMSYQANFASHHTRNRHVGFLLAWHGIEKYNKMFPYFLFSSYYNTKL